MASRLDNQENRAGDTANSNQPATPSSLHRRSASERPNPHDSIQSLTGVEVIATGACAPSEVVRNEDLAQLGYDADWIVQRTGIRERRRAPADQATSDVALAAARHCLQQAQFEFIDCQQNTPHLRSMGAHTVSRADYLKRLMNATLSATKWDV